MYSTQLCLARCLSTLQEEADAKAVLLDSGPERNC
jgi:hypothetical protein